ncbi:hypothetical protein [Azospirillum sp.]|uniref:hypothetical protein n=1 Tax=Azospirillum sp. TaxID=34012 RepID=UPI002D6B313D|nr:hypothetical protein [Azospirillum sp.]HYD69323.1 hypothetical protein [Azospirillum sp.]
MADTSNTPPFVRHHRTARALVHTLHEALAPQLVTKGALTHEEFARAFARLMEEWPRVLPLFARTCRTCTAGRMEQPLPPPGFRADEAEGRRRDYVTRLMFSTILANVPEAQDPISGAVFPRVAAPGLQAHLNALFYEKEWEAMNADALSIFAQIGTDRDEEIWARVHRHATLPVLSDALYVRVMLRFKQFAFQRQSFMRRMVQVLENRRFTFTEEHFNALFAALFDHLREEIRTELGRARVDVRYGDETSGALMRIFAEFDKAREDRTRPIRGIGGAMRPITNRTTR